MYNNAGSEKLVRTISDLTCPVSRTTLMMEPKFQDTLFNTATFFGFLSFQSHFPALFLVLTVNFYPLYYFHLSPLLRGYFWGNQTKIKYVWSWHVSYLGLKSSCVICHLLSSSTLKTGNVPDSDSSVGLGPRTRKMWSRAYS